MYKPKFLKKIMGVSLGLALTPTLATASLRVDSEDFPPNAVVQQSLQLAERHPFANATVAIWVNDRSLATGVAVDPYTILTAAHTAFLRDAEKIVVVSSSNAQSLPEDCVYAALAESEVILHGPFMENPFKDKILRAVTQDETTGELMMQEKPLAELEHSTFADFMEPKLHYSAGFFGIDLAVIKLVKPLPESIIYPEILSLDGDIDGKYGEALGFGPMKFNYQDQGPMLVTDNPQEMVKRHLINAKLSSYQGKEAFTGLDLSLIYSSYKGLLVNGNESFIADQAMLPTEGMPVGGDSGGPLFVKQGAEPKLVGLLSSTITYSKDEIPESPARDLLREFRQPIFNVWTDLRYYQDWIKEQMGPIE